MTAAFSIVFKVFLGRIPRELRKLYSLMNVEVVCSSIPPALLWVSFVLQLLTAIIKLCIYKKGKSYLPADVLF